MPPTNRPDAGRPDPDALLAAFHRETAGRLKVFLGAAPGVGKTYAMLQNARRLRDEGADVVLVDLTPDELIQRLNDGKVYVPETARRATQNFFTPGNLTALRELALRRTANRVDDQMVDYLRQKAIEGPWAASERLLACVGADEVSERVIRRASQLATGLNAEWTAVTVETAGQAGDA